MKMVRAVKYTRNANHATINDNSPVTADGNARLQRSCWWNKLPSVDLRSARAQSECPRRPTVNELTLTNAPFGIVRGKTGGLARAPAANHEPSRHSLRLFWREACGAAVASRRDFSMTTFLRRLWMTWHSDAL